MDAEFEFGELEQQEPATLRPPSCNKHFAVAACGSPSDDDLPMYVDLDAMRDMELHALSDTNVELGGVLLGGQYVDENGKPFVLITDSLRACHYKNSKGSFTFTHETWEQITRERDQFPDDVQMVGWYHTHPGWGVFLSGMDLFICNNFFNKPLDAALVIDPCNDDRGFFQWVRQEDDAVRRTDGFYVVASRFREAELAAFAQQLEGRKNMTTPVGGPPHPAHFPPPPPDHWRSVAMMGMLATQFLLLFLIAWRMTAPAAPADSKTPNSKVIARLEKLEQNLENRSLLVLQEENLTAQREMLDRIVAQMGGGSGESGGAPLGLVQSLEEERRKNAALNASMLGQNALNQSLLESQRELKDALELVHDARQADQKAWKKKTADWERKSKEFQREIGDVHKESGDALASQGDLPYWQTYPFWLGVTAVVVVLGLGVGLAFNGSPKTSQESPENDHRTPNNE